MYACVGKYNYVCAVPAVGIVALRFKAVFLDRDNKDLVNDYFALFIRWTGISLAILNAIKLIHTKRVVRIGRWGLAVREHAILNAYI